MHLHGHVWFHGSTQVQTTNYTFPSNCVIFGPRLNVPRGRFFTIQLVTYWIKTSVVLYGT